MLQELRNALPDYAKDIRTNLDAVLSEAGAPGLNGKQILAIALASAIASRETRLIAALGSEAVRVLSAEELRGTRAAATIMAMNNIYYRYTHLVSDPAYQQMPARLRMTVIANPGLDKTSFELCSIAVSAINGCGMCMDSHEKVLRQHGVTPEAIHSAVRIAAVIHAAAVSLVAASAGSEETLAQAA